jgi:hypothetical protein
MALLAYGVHCSHQMCIKKHTSPGQPMSQQQQQLGIILIYGEFLKTA